MNKYHSYKSRASSWMNPKMDFLQGRLWCCVTSFWVIAGITSHCQASPSHHSQITVIGMCPCPENNASLLVRLDIPHMEDILARATQLSKDLKIDKNQVSAKHRQRTSAYDSRLSSKSMGVLGLMVILFVIGFVVVSDVISYRETRGSRLKRRLDKHRKSSAASSSVSIETTMTSASLSTLRRNSTASTSIGNSFHVMNDLCLNKDRLSQMCPSALTIINSQMVKSPSEPSISVKTPTTNIIVCYKPELGVLPSTVTNRLPASFEGVAGKSGKSKTHETIPNIIITCGEREEMFKK